jgi:hypothetical protein
VCFPSLPIALRARIVEGAPGFLSLVAIKSKFFDYLNKIEYD